MDDVSLSENFFNNEAHFSLRGYVNKQNCERERERGRKEAYCRMQVSGDTAIFNAELNDRMASRFLPYNYTTKMFGFSKMVPHVTQHERL